MNCTYNFRVVPPNKKVAVVIEETDEEGLLLAAAFSGARRPLNDRTLLWALLAYPLMTLKVVMGIHWEALRLFAKKTPIIRHSPAAKKIAVSIVDPAKSQTAGR